MKKLILVVSVLLGMVILSLVLVPVLFKDNIQKAIQTELDNTLDATLLFDKSQFSVSLISGFPNISVGLGDVGLTGKGAFLGDTLFFASKFDLSLDLMSVISGDQIKILEIIVDQPTINILINKEGLANYDIMIDSGSEDEQSAESENAAISVAMNHWVLTGGTIRYIDDTLPYYLELTEVDHEGSGDFVGDIFTMVSSTNAGSFSTGYDDVEYLSNKQLAGEVTMEMDLEKFKFTFKENQVSLNGFNFSFDGWLAMPSSDIEMDITFSGEEIDLKSILSLTPGDYESYLEGIVAEGQVGFQGMVKGTYNDERMPATKMTFTVDNGQISYTEYPIPMQKIFVHATFDMPGADLTQASFVMDKYSMLIDGEAFDMRLVFKDFEDYFWDLSANGKLDLEKLTGIIPLGDMKLLGKVDAGLSTSGRMSDLEAENYDQLPTSGTMQVSDFLFQSEDLPQGFGIRAMDAAFNPQEIKLLEFKGNAGKTDLNMSGAIQNYLGYALGENEVLSGQLKFSSELVDIDEWMTDEAPMEDTEPEDTSAMTAPRIPENILFVMEADIKSMMYDNLDIKSFAGQVEIKEGAIYLNQVGFGLLEGFFVMNGVYDSKEDLPVYSYDLEIKDLSIPNAFKSFNTVQKLAPFAEKMNGKFSTNFAIAGALDDGMMPIYETITGKGLLKIAQASLSDVKLMSAVSSVTSLKDSDGSVSLKNVRLKVQIEEGKVEVEPFDIQLGGYTTTVSGSNAIDGNLSYRFKVQSVPTGGAGQAVSSALSSLVGTSSLTLDKVDVKLGVTGTFLEPKVGLLGVSPAGSNEEVTVSDQAKNIVTEKISVKKEEITQQVDSVKTVAVDSAKAVIDQQKNAAQEAVSQEADKVKEKAKESVKDLFKKKKKSGGGK